MKSLFRFFASILNFPEVIRNITKYWELIKVLTWRDFVARYRGSFAGIFWAVIQPLFMMIVYTLVFSRFLGVRFGNSGSTLSFSVNLLCGLIAWNAFSEGLNISTSTIRANITLVKKVVFPLEVLPIDVTFVALIQHVIGLLILLPLSIFDSRQVYATLLFVPVIMFLQILFSLGMNWIWAGIAVNFPDLRQLTGVMMSALIFATPIFYPLESIPHSLSILIRLNPFSYFVIMYRDIIVNGVLPSWQMVLGTFAFAYLIFMIGYRFFMRQKKGFADVL